MPTLAGSSDQSSLSKPGSRSERGAVAQRPVEVVRPRVVVALERRARAAAVHQHRAAVAADVQERAQLAVAVARDDDRHAAGVGREERARRGHLLGAAAVLPASARRCVRARSRSIASSLYQLNGRVRASAGAAMREGY